MSHDPEQDAIDARRARITALLERLAYPTGSAAGGPPAKRVELLAQPDIGQAVYVTGDSVDFVDYYYYPLLGFGSRSQGVGVSSGADGRWSCFRDAVRYKAEPSITGKGPMSLRQLIGQVEDAQVIVLAFRPAGAALTQISVTVLPDDENPRLHRG